MNIQALIVSPTNCKPGDLIWACSYRKNHEKKTVSDMFPTYGILTLTNRFEDESKHTGFPPQGKNFTLSAYSCYHAKYQSYLPRYFVPVVHGRILWKDAIALSTVLLAQTKQDCEDIYQNAYETAICEEDKEENPYLLISKLHKEHPKTKHLRIGQFLWLFQEWHQKQYKNDIFYIENKELVKRIEQYLQTMK